MAYFSDTQDTPAKRGFVPPQSDDERRLMRRVEELCRVAQSRGIPRAESGAGCLQQGGL